MSCFHEVHLCLFLSLFLFSLSVSISVSPTLFLYSLTLTRPQTHLLPEYTWEYQRGTHSIFHGPGSVTNKNPGFILHRPKQVVPGSCWWVLGKNHSEADKLTRSSECGLANSKYCFCCSYKLMYCLLVHSGRKNAQGDCPHLERAAGKEMLVGLWD